MLTVLDEYTPETLCIVVAVRMETAEILEALFPLLLQRGKPDYVRSEIGSEFVAAPHKERRKRVCIEPVHHYSGSP